jgi:bifunctional UDP-N-acetylglucosamine pyrophosphorylase / glucosamine-1-phosphate N-acetyltransferase
MKSRKAKVLHRAGGRTLIEHAVATALELAPPERIFVVVGHEADEVRKAIATPGIGFIDQAEQKGTGHAVLVGRHALEPLGGYLVIIYGDGPLLRAATLRRLIAKAETSLAAGVLLTALMEDPTGYGRVVRPHGHKPRHTAGLGDPESILAIIEEKAANPEQLSIREANMGIYCYRSELFWKHAGEMRADNPAGEYYLTDMVAILRAAGHRIEAVRIDDAREALGINNRVELAEADRLLRERKVRELMLGGVTIEKPETVTVDPEVSIGADTIIGPFAQILGKTRIGEDCRVGACSIVEDTEMGDAAEIGPFTFVRASLVERGAQIGPFARLRFGNRVEEGAHVGNFVELKNAHLGAGTKANHLAYLGDAEIGARTNIGAGTITCNYDGIRKHQTTIGRQVFVGSNSTLVAPLEIGDGAYLGAGSVITDAVPPDALALGRARQVVKDQWAARRRGRDGSQGPRAGS